MTSNYEIIKESGGHGSVFEATCVPTGLRSRFQCVEHINVGKAWLMRDLEARLPGPVMDDALTDMTLISRSEKKLVVESPVEFHFNK